MLPSASHNSRQRQVLFWLCALSLVAGCSRSISPETAPSPTADSAPAATGGAEATTPAQPPLEKAAKPTAATIALTDTLVVPGERVGPVNRGTDRVSLAAEFGEANLTDTEIPVGEGFTEWGTVVAEQTEQTFAVIWVDDSQTQPATVKDFGRDWATPEGIQVGMSFADLQSILGPFTLYGFGWDYGGTLVLEGTNLSDYYGSLILRLQPADPAVFQTQAAAFQAVQGDKLISSDDPNLTALDLVVSEMIVYLTPPGG